MKITLSTKEINNIIRLLENDNMKLNKALNSQTTSYEIKQDCKNIINSNKITLDKLRNESYNKLTILFSESKE